MLDRRQLMILAGLGLASPRARSTQPRQPAHQHSMPAASQKRQVAILFYENAIIHDYANAADMFLIAGFMQDFNVFSVAETTEPIPNRFFPSSLRADHDFAHAPKADVVIIPGGEWSKLWKDKEDGRTALFDWLRARVSDGAIVLAICTGTYVLGISGLIDGKEATSLPAEIQRFKKHFPKVKVRENAAFVDAGQFVTASGGYTGIDAALHVIARLVGVEKARYVAHKYMVHESWRPMLPPGTSR
jgi:transcriptional regulator GlxA family with amidase domain